MTEAGIFASDARLELIEGEILQMPPVGDRQTSVAMTLNRLLVRRTGDRALVYVSGPVALSDRSVPQPDFALLKTRGDHYMRALPRAADMLLGIEVADTKLAFDLQTKVPLYAHASIPEAWVVDVSGRVIHVFLDPDERGYQRRFLVKGEQTVRCAALPQVEVAPIDLFPK